MTADSWSTHTLGLGPGTVTKRFRPGSDAQSEREWRALTLLDVHAPGLAPAPRHADLAADEPTVVMSRLPGGPLRGQRLDERRLDALASAVSEVYEAVPAHVLDEVPVRPGHRRYLTDRIRAWAPRARPRVGPEVGRAMDGGLEWLAGAGLEGAVPPAVRPVFGPGDGNLANYLWDGSRVRIVDFEESGRSDRPLELAEITEHVAAWVDEPLDVEGFLGRFDLDAAERPLLLETRRLLALVWLFLLSFDDPGHPRNPPGTVERQAARLTRLLA
ncbi:aminoglycoside phosphotransferase family protein [Streptomyces sp. NPDC005803]|uniref:phosphotransferase family protein n=1 Tax=Streptomyces sp. NPDC005803 TaxID=3154297 RepID=UPI0033D8EFCF